MSLVCFFEHEIDKPTNEINHLMYVNYNVFDNKKGLIDHHN